MKYLCLYFLTWRLQYDHLSVLKQTEIKKIIKNLTFKDLVKAGVDNAY